MIENREQPITPRGLHIDPAKAAEITAELEQAMLGVDAVLCRDSQAACSHRFRPDRNQFKKLKGKPDEKKAAFDKFCTAFRAKHLQTLAATRDAVRASAGLQAESA